MKEVSYEEALRTSETPARVVLAVSFDSGNNRSNIIALGWKMRTSLQPPMVAISIGKTRYSHQLLNEVGEFVLAFPGEDLAEQVFFCGTNSGRNVDKFKEANLTPVEAKSVKPALIEECAVNFECRVTGTLETGDHTIFAGEVLTSWVSDEKKKLLLSVSYQEAYQVLLEKKGHRLGVVKG